MEQLPFEQQPLGRQRERDQYEHPSEAGSVIETRALLDELDEDALKDIFARELKKSGQEPKQILLNRFVPFESIVVDGGKCINAGEYDPQNGEITIFSSSIENSATNMSHAYVDDAQRTRLKALLQSIGTGYLFTEKGRALKDFADYISAYRTYDPKTLQDILFKIEVTHVIIHEELHALTDHVGQEIRRRDEEDDTEEYIGNKLIGVSNQYSYRREGGGEVTFENSFLEFDGLNEGLTELIARRLTQEYLKRVAVEGVNSKDINMFVAQAEAGAYPREQWVFELLTLLYSVVSEVPEVVILDAMTRTYLSGESPILPPEFRTAVREQAPDIDQPVYDLLYELECSISTNRFDKEADAEAVSAFDKFIKILPESKQGQFNEGLALLSEKYKICREMAA